MKLTPEAVREIFMDCLFNEGEPTDDAVEVDGIVNAYGFHPQRVRDNTKTIVEFLDELPDSFKQGSGDGMSFLNACYDKYGFQWTGEHDIMEMLFCLGMAIGKVKSCVNRSMWEILPGAMPYYVVLK